MNLLNELVEKQFIRTENGQNIYRPFGKIGSAYLVQIEQQDKIFRLNRISWIVLFSSLFLDRILINKLPISLMCFILGIIIFIVLNLLCVGSLLKISVEQIGKPLESPPFSKNFKRVFILIWLALILLNYFNKNLP